MAKANTRYSDKDLERFRKLILDKIDKAKHDLDLIKSAYMNDHNNGTEDTAPTFKAFDEGSSVMSKESNSQLALRQEKFIRDLKTALIRIENKTYGVCRVTGKLISKRRLKLVPHATLSIQAKNNRIIIFGSTLLVILLSIVGIFKLEVENSFINYFDKETEIYKGMKKIDDDLGGTTPLNIILKFPVKKKEIKEENDEFDEWEEENETNEDKAKYWFTRDKMDKIIKVHDYLDSLPEIGKVLSFGSILRVAEDLNNKELQSLEIAVLYSKIPEAIKKEIVTPYISVDEDEARISLRIKDSLENLRRNDLIKKINSDLNTKLGLDRDEYKLAGVLILFNNLLQSLFKSQILTLGIVMLGIFLMFLVLFRNIVLASIGVVPNFIAAFFILGIIGLLGIPLDMMTITIAAITIGIAVDNSIHYIYRFKEEFKKINNYNKTLDRCHSTVGVAILNTSITIVFGFSILVLSNFIPTIYFGIFTGIAMLLAMISVLTLLPKLLLVYKPFGEESDKLI